MKKKKGKQKGNGRVKKNRIRVGPLPFSFYRKVGVWSPSPMDMAPMRSGASWNFYRVDGVVRRPMLRRSAGTETPVSRAFWRKREKSRAWLAGQGHASADTAMWCFCVDFFQKKKRHAGSKERVCPYIFVKHLKNAHIFWHAILRNLSLSFHSVFLLASVFLFFFLRFPETFWGLDGNGGKEKTPLPQTTKKGDRVSRVFFSRSAHLLAPLAKRCLCDKGQGKKKKKAACDENDGTHTSVFLQRVPRPAIPYRRSKNSKGADRETGVTGKRHAAIKVQGRNECAPCMAFFFSKSFFLAQKVRLSRHVCNF